MTNFEPMGRDLGVNLVRRAYATPAFHRLLPWPVALATVRVRAARLWNVPALREHAYESMAFVLGALADDREIEAAARRWVFETVKRDELTWRPWQTTRFPVEGAETLRHLALAKRGAIVSFIHHGQYGGTFGSLARQGVHCNVAVLPLFFEAWKPGYDGLRDRRHIKTVTMGGTTIFSAKSCFDHMCDLLAGGGHVGIASDLPGSAPMTVLGRRVSAASGAARLALETGAPIVPVTAHRHGEALQALVVGAPIEPAGKDLPALQQAIADAHEPALRAWPEGLMEPLERWHLVVDAEASAA